MENYPTPRYNSYGDTASEMAPAQVYLGLDLDWNFESEAMPTFGEAMPGTQGYPPNQDYMQLDYPHQECIPPSVIDPAGGNYDPNKDLGFDNFGYNNYGGMPGVPSPAPTVTSSGMTAPGTPFDFPRDFNSPQPQAIGPRVSQCSSELFVPKDNNWTYGMIVWPAKDIPGHRDVEHHRNALQEALRAKGTRYTPHTILNGPTDSYRLYKLSEKLRDSEKARLEFMQVFNANRPYNQRLKNYRFRMSVVGYEPRDFGLGSSYPNISDPSGNDGINSPFEDDPVSGLPLLPDSPTHHHFGSLPATSPQPVLSAPKSDSAQPADTPAAASRIKAIPKPDRQAIKNENGKYICNFAECTEDVKVFGRKCEWSKHMDKHDRPYKCAVEGCEKLPGFTYSGGLLRHEREVHGKHGGPKNPLNCPHPNCKRFSGKGFSRLENLNEHLRRVHTNGAAVGDIGADDHESIATMEAAEHVVVGEKRKADDEDLRVEIKKLHVENQDLKAKLDAQERQTEALMEQMRQLQDNLSSLQQMQDARLSSGAVMLDDHTSAF